MALICLDTHSTLAQDIFQSGPKLIEIAAKYGNTVRQRQVANLLTQLFTEMETMRKAGRNPDILGEWYETHALSANEEDLISWDTCEIMAFVIRLESTRRPPVRLVDMACRSGRLLMCLSCPFGLKSQYYGITTKDVFAKMTAVNMLLSSLIFGEVMVLDRLEFGNFILCYQFVRHPLGIVEITNTIESVLWPIYYEKWRNPKRAPGLHEEPAEGMAQTSILFI
jgi:hypothetical protein